MAPTRPATATRGHGSESWGTPPELRLEVDGFVLPFPHSILAECGFWGSVRVRYLGWGGWISNPPGMVLRKGQEHGLEVVFNASAPFGARAATLNLRTDEGAALGAIGNDFSYELMATAVPEPTSFGMLLAGLGCLGVYMQRRTRHGASPVAS